MMGNQGVAGRSVPDGLGSADAPEPHSGLGPSGAIPSALKATVDCDRCVGIVSPYGNLWTWEAFETPEKAEAHLRSFWRVGHLSEAEIHKFKLCVVSVVVQPESAPFDLPSASAIEAATAGETVKLGSTEGESAAPQEDAQHG